MKKIYQTAVASVAAVGIINYTHTYTDAHTYTLCARARTHTLTRTYSSSFCPLLLLRSSVIFSIFLSIFFIFLIILFCFFNSYFCFVLHHHHHHHQHHHRSLPLYRTSKQGCLQPGRSYYTPRLYIHTYITS